MRKCYPNSAPAGGAIGDGDGRAVARRDFAHDGEAEAAAGARRAGHAIEALEHPLALLPRDAWAVVLDLQERGSIAPAGAHRDAPAALRIFKRVVHQVRERLAQQKGVTVEARRL